VLAVESGFNVHNADIADPIMPAKSIRKNNILNDHFKIFLTLIFFKSHFVKIPFL
jgi:hypothetical protein